MSTHLAVRSRPADTIAAWSSAGWKAGFGLGGGYGVIMGLVGGGPLFGLIGLGAGCLLGLPIGLAAGFLDGLLLGLLTRPLGLSPATRASRNRTTAAAAVITALILLPVGLVYWWPFEAVVGPIAASVITAAAVARRLPPGGRMADPGALVRISEQ